MKFKILVYLSLIFCFECNASSVLSWGDVAKLEKSAVEQLARDYISENAPHLDKVEVKLSQISLSFHPKHGQSLSITFLHANSMKPLAENKTLGIQDPNYPIQYYMEIIDIEFSIDGVPEALILREQLLLNTEEKSFNLFRKLYENI